MNKITILLGLLFGIAVSSLCVASEWRSCTLKSAEVFPVQGRVTGKIKIANDRVIFKMTSTSLKLHPNSNKSLFVDGLQVGLAYEHKPDHWNFVGLAPLYPFSSEIPVAKTVEVEQFESTLKLADRNIPRRSWVVMQIAISDGQGNTVGRAYAHEPNTPTN